MAYKIMLDPGHGGTDPGAVYEGRQEKDDALRLATAVGEILRKNGYDVEFTVRGRRSPLSAPPVQARLPSPT